MGRRNQTIDTIRGIAIVIMIAANAWPSIYPFEVCPIMLRVLFSTAAPIFIFLSGMSIFLAQQSGKSSADIAKRAAQVLFLAAGIDALVWSIVPFYTMDVLYLIAIANFVLIVFKSINKQIQFILLFVIIGSIFFTGELYQFQMEEVTWLEIAENYNGKSAVRHMLFDGWFPLFPWLGVAILGYIVGAYEGYLSKFKFEFLTASFLLITTYLLTFFSGQNVQPLRDGYTELFYPVNGYFLVYLIGLYSLIIYFQITDFLHVKLLSDLGKVSLPIYLLHSIIIRFLIPFFQQSDKNFRFEILLAGLLVFYLLIFASSFILNKYHKALKNGKYKILGSLIGI